MKQVKLTYEMLCWERLLSLVGNNHQEADFRKTLRRHLDSILKGLEEKSIEIIDLDEITLQDFNYFLKNYPIKRSINFDSSSITILRMLYLIIVLFLRVILDIVS